MNENEATNGSEVTKGPLTIPEMMTNYIGTKNVKAFPMMKSEYLDYRGWKLDDGVDPNEPVYLVEYEADPLSKPNHPGHAGYITFSPKHVFDKAYRVSGTYLDRLKIENDDLIDKITTLEGDLMVGGIPKNDVVKAEQQLIRMREYRDILLSRIG